MVKLNTILYALYNVSYSTSGCVSVWSHDLNLAELSTEWLFKLAELPITWMTFTLQCVRHTQSISDTTKNIAIDSLFSDGVYIVLFFVCQAHFIFTACDYSMIFNVVELSTE